MFLKNKTTGDLIEVSELEALISPTQSSVPGKDQAGQEEQELSSYPKHDLIFPSGEDLPRCWVDAEYTTR